MFQRIWGVILVCFTLSLVAAYFFCIGYYILFHFDITPFLSISDLTIVFSRWIWYGILLIAFILLPIYDSLQNDKPDTGWMGQCIGRTNFKRRALFIFPLIIFAVVASVWNKSIRDILVLAIGIISGAAILIAAFYGIYLEFSEKRKLSEVSFKTWFGIVFMVCFLLIGLPFIAGLMMAQYNTPQDVRITLENDTIVNTATSNDLIYIKKTTDYFFIYNRKTDVVTAFNKEKCRSVEISDKKE